MKKLYPSVFKIFQYIYRNLKILFLSLQNLQLYSKQLKITDMEKRKSLYTVGENVKWCSPYRKKYRDTLKIKNRTIL